MAAASLYRVDVMAAQDGDRDSGTAGGVAAYQLPLRNAGGGHPALVPFLDADFLGKADVAHQAVQIVVIVPDSPFVRGFVIIAVEDAVGGFSIHRIKVDVDRGPVARFLLGNGKDVAVEARRPDPYHIAMALVKLHGKHEHIADAVHRFSEVSPAVSIEAVDVEIGDAGHFVGGQRDLDVRFFVQPELVVSGRKGGVVFRGPIKDGAQLLAYDGDGRSLQAACLAEGDEVTPKDIRYLHGLQADAVLTFQFFEVVDKAADALAVVRHQAGFRLHAGIDYGQQGVILEVEGKRIAQGCFKVGAKVGKRRGLGCGAIGRDDNGVHNASDIMLQAVNNGGAGPLATFGCG